MKVRGEKPSSPLTWHGCRTRQNNTETLHFSFYRLCAWQQAAHTGWADLSWFMLELSILACENIQTKSLYDTKKWSDGQIRGQTHPSHKSSLTTEGTGSCKVLLHLWSRAILSDREERRIAKCIKVEQRRCFWYRPVFARILWLQVTETQFQPV